MTREPQALTFNVIEEDDEDDDVEYDEDDDFDDDFYVVDTGPRALIFDDTPKNVNMQMAKPVDSVPKPSKLNLDAIPSRVTAPMTQEKPPVKKLDLDSVPTPPRSKPQQPTTAAPSKPIVLPDAPKKSAVPSAPRNMFDAKIVVGVNETPAEKTAKRAKSAIALTDKLCAVNYAAAEVKVLSSIDDTLVNLTNENPTTLMKRQMQLILTIITSGNKEAGMFGSIKNMFSGKDESENMRDLVARVNVTVQSVEACLTDMNEFIKRLDAVMADITEAFANVQVYINVGNEELQVNGELTKKLLAADLVSTDMMKLQAAQDKCRSIEQFEKRISYLRQIIQMSQMSMHQIKLMQDTTIRLMTKARSIIEQTVPQWKKQFISIYVSNASKGLRNVAESEKAVLQSMQEQLKAEIQQVIS